MGRAEVGPWELPEGWETARLGDLVETKTGFACAKKNLVSQGVPHLRPFNVGTNGELDLFEVYQIPEGYRANIEDYALEPGHILFNNTNSVKLVGKTAVVREPLRTAFSNHITRLTVNDTHRVDPAWVALALRQLWATGYFAANCNRWIGQAGFNTRMLSEVEIPLPDPEEQRRIVARIEALFAELAEARRLHEAACRDADALMGTVLAGAFPDLEKDWPEGWKVKAVAEISERPQYGYTQSASWEPVGPRFLRITDIQDGQVDWETAPHCECDEATLKKYRLQTGDLVFARSGATTGKTYLVREPPEAVFASYLIRLRIYQDVSPEYVYWFFQSPYYWNQVQPRGAAQPNMNARILGSLRVPIPGDDATQHRIVAYLDEVQTQVRWLKQAQEVVAVELERLEQAILARAFRGEL
jgi:type I restriction enzyme S subunit